MSILKIARHVQFKAANPDKTDNEWLNVVDDVADHLGFDEQELQELTTE